MLTAFPGEQLPWRWGGKGAPPTLVLVHYWFPASPITPGKAVPEVVRMGDAFGDGLPWEPLNSPDPQSRCSKRKPHCEGGFPMGNPGQPGSPETGSLCQEVRARTPKDQTLAILLGNKCPHPPTTHMKRYKIWGRC